MVRLYIVALSGMFVSAFPIYADKKVNESAALAVTSCGVGLETGAVGSTKKPKMFELN